MSHRNEDKAIIKRKGIRCVDDLQTLKMILDENPELKKKVQNLFQRRRQRQGK